MTWPETKFTRLYPPYKKPDRRARFIPYPLSLSLSSILSSFNFFDNLERAFFFFSSLVKNITRLIACISRLSVPGKHSAIFFTYRIASFQIATATARFKNCPTWRLTRYFQLNRKVHGGRDVSIERARVRQSVGIRKISPPPSQRRLVRTAMTK